MNIKSIAFASALAMLPALAITSMAASPAFAQANGGGNGGGGASGGGGEGSFGLNGPNRPFARVPDSVSKQPLRRVQDSCNQSAQWRAHNAGPAAKTCGEY